MVEDREPPFLRVRFLLAFALGSFGVLTALGYLGGLSWALELASHFRLQYAIAAALLAPIAAWQAGRRWALASLAIAVPNALSVAPLYLPRNVATVSGEPLVVASFNVATHNENIEAIVAFVAETDAHVTVLLEVSESLHDALAGLPAPHRLVLGAPRGDNFGIAVVARVPVEARVVESQDLPFVEVILQHGGARWTLLGVHPVPPVGPVYAARRNASFADIAAWARAQTGPHAVVGDLNATPFSPRFQRLLTAGGLESTQPGHGYQATWPRHEPFLWPLQIPIDHVLVGGGAFATSRHVGDARGSDHRPVHATLVAR
jgi:endonuclease/exonuclease/phosphatase (EEP) superfamily protein YafD